MRVSGGTASVERLRVSSRTVRSRPLRLTPGWARIAAMLTLLVLWEITARFGDPLFVAPPSAVPVALYSLAQDPALLGAVGSTLIEFAAAFVLTVLFGVLIGLVMGLHKFSNRTVYPMIVTMYALPQTVLLPLMMMGIGHGAMLKIVFGISHGIVPVIMAVTAGVSNVNPALVRCAQSMGASRTQVFLSITLRGLIPSLFTGVRLGTTGVLIGVLLAELYVTTFGSIGYYTNVFANKFQPANLIALIIVLAIIAIAMNELGRQLERYFNQSRS